MSTGNISSRKYSISMRVWHWSNYILITLLLISVLIGFTILKTKYNIPLFQNEIQKAGGVLTKDQARALTKSLSNQLWQWHTYLGYALVAGFLFRFAMEFYIKREQRFIVTLKNYFRLNKSHKTDKEVQHKLWVKIAYGWFYFSLLVIVLTGLGMAFDEELSLSKEVKGMLKDIHYYFMYSILAFVVLHIAGVLVAENNKDKGIVSDMINGGEE